MNWMLRRLTTRPVGATAMWVGLGLAAVCMMTQRGWTTPFVQSRAAAAAEVTRDAEGELMVAVFADDAGAIHHACTNASVPRSDYVRAVALTTAVTLGHQAAVTELLHCGVKVDSRTLQGRTALMLAAGIPGQSDIVKKLVDAGANPNAVSRLGETPMSEAIRGGDPATIELLEEAGARFPDR